MQFLSPWLFAALAALSIPIIIHLLNLRKPQTLRFSTIAFFKVIQQSTIRRIQLKKWILLIIRLLALLMLVLALVRPFVTSGYGDTSLSGQARLYLILVDNSPSMSQVDINGPYMQQVKDVLLKLVQQAGVNDQFILAPTNGEWTLRGRVDAGRARELIDELEWVEKGNFVADRIQSLLQAAKDPGNAIPMLFAITDAQQSQFEALSTEEGALNADAIPALPVQVIQIGKEPNPNTTITDLRIKSRMVGTGQPVLVEVEVTHFSQNPIDNLYLTIETEGVPGGQYKIEQAAGEAKRYTFEVYPQRSGSLTGRVLLEGDAFNRDDQRFFSIPVPEKKQVLYVYSSSKARDASYLLPVLMAAEEAGGQVAITVSTLNQVPVPDAFDVIILDGLDAWSGPWIEGLQAFVQNGKSLILLPDANADLQGYNAFLERFLAPTYSGKRGIYGQETVLAQWTKFEREHPVLESLFEFNENEALIRVESPDFYHYWLIDARFTERTRVLFESNLSEPLVVEQPFGTGKLLLFAFGTDAGWSNLASRSIFAPLSYRLVMYASTDEEMINTEVKLGQGLDLIQRWSAEKVDLVLNEVVYKPEMRQTRNGQNLRYQGQEWQPGLLRVQSEADALHLAVNMPVEEYDFKKVDADDWGMFFKGNLTPGALQTWNGQSSLSFEEYFRMAGLGREIWYVFLVLGILLLMLESFISRWYKAENV